MKKDLFKKGDTVWDFSYGWGEVIDIGGWNSLHPVVVRFDDNSNRAFTPDGRVAANIARTLFFEEITIQESALKSKPWRAKPDGVYFFLDSTLEIVESTEDKCSIDDARWSIGNYFETKKEAAEFRRNMKELLQLNN